MADYNIYIHSFMGGGGAAESSPTKPWANQSQGGETSMFQTLQEVADNAQQLATSGVSNYAAMGVAQLSKASPFIALVVGSIVVGNKILTTGFRNVETYLGNYEYSMRFNNFKTTISNFLNPIGTGYKFFARNYQYQLQNERTEQQRLLFGNSILNTSFKGV